MLELKPTWRIAQQISKRHTQISLMVTVPLVLGTLVIAILVLKILGYDHSGLILKQFFEHHRRGIISTLIFIHLIPVNYYAIMRVFSADFNNFELKIFLKRD